MQNGARGARNLRLALLGAKTGGAYARHRARRVFTDAGKRQELDLAFELKTTQQVAEALGQMKGALMKVGQMALNYGCNDFGSLMIEENVVSAANTTHRTTVGELDRLIQDAGFTPARRRQDYSLISGGAQAHATVAA